MTVTRAMLEKLRAERARPQLQMDYTIGGSIQTAVATAHTTQREHRIAETEKTLKEALQDFREQRSLASSQGLAKAHFNHRQ